MHEKAITGVQQELGSLKRQEIPRQIVQVNMHYDCIS